MERDILQISSAVGLLAQKALLYELALTPKPGLVDLADNGSHHDMNPITFIDSAMALAPFFVELVQLGQNFEGNAAELFQESRKIGILMEEAMMTATKGINTHKGAVFTLALILTACGHRLINHDLQKWQASDTEAVFAYIQQMTQTLNHDFTQLTQKKAAQMSFGERLYVEYGIKGIRGEAMAGYPAIKNFGLPSLRHSAGQVPNIRLQDTFLVLLANVTDSNVIHRSNLEMLTTVQAEAKALLEAGGVGVVGMEAMNSLNRAYIARNISPGGTADLLAGTIFFGFMERIL